MRIRACLICGTSFEARRARSAMCSDECRKERRKDHMRKYYCRDPLGRQEKVTRRYYVKCATDPDWVERERERKRVYQSIRYATDPDYVERSRKRSRDNMRKRLADPEYRAKANENQKSRYWVKKEDPAWVNEERERHRDRAQRMRSVLKAVKELGLIKIGDLKC